MKYFSLFILYILILCLKSSAQGCGNDSVVTMSSRHFSDGDITLTIRVDSFDLINGNVYLSQRTGTNTLPGPPTYNQSTFTRNLISYNSNHDTIQYIALKGNGSGYDNEKKVEFTYSNNRPLTRIEYDGFGAVWNLVKSETWTYNGNNFLTSYVLSDITGNVSQKIYSYSGSQGTSLTFQIWSAGAWLNNEKYLFTYTLGRKDSLYVQSWNIASGSWIDSLSAKYDTINFRATISRIDTIGSNDKVFTYTIDTLSNVIIQHSFDNIFQESNTVSYKYFNSHLLVSGISHGNSASNSSHSFIYNQYGILISEYSSTTSSMSQSNSTTIYDSLSHPVSENYSSYSGSHDGDLDYNYSYSSASKISLSFIPIADYYGMHCQGDSLQTIPMVSGGCGPYHFNWSPSLRLSSDTIADPKISLHDTTLYQVTVSDSTGHSATTTFQAYSEYSRTITFDTTLCSGCPVVLSTQGGSNISFSWYRNDTLINGAYGSTFTAITSGSYSVSVSTSQCTFFTDPVHLTLTGLTRITGRLYLDLDSNCAHTPGDRNLSMYGVSPYLIKLERQPYLAYISPDSNGLYDIPIDTGLFSLSIINPATFYSPSCPDSGIVNIYIPAYGDTINGVDLVLKPKYNCQRLGVSVSASQFRPCNNATLRINYFNEGTIDESSPVVNVSLPTELINISSSQPYSILPGNVYSFSLQPLMVGVGGSFEINAGVICNPAQLINATLCVDAEIKPVDFCSLEPDSTWDGSNVRVASHCQNDSIVCFTIINDAAFPGGDMNSFSVWRLYGDNILVQSGTFHLNAFQDTTLCFNSDGRTFRLEADQTSGFPENNFPSASIERCGFLQPGHSYSLNKILQHAINNTLPFYYTYCSVVRSSFDPNEKSVQPSSTYISKDNRLKYRIDFQNTGNDTAFKVVITDEIQYGLDISTLQLLSSSHAYQFHIDGNTFVWEFAPIILPDSNINEYASHGYVEFSIKPLQSLSIGTWIGNQAKIYFDSNPEINTSYLFSIICESGMPLANLHTIGEYCPGQPLQVTADVQFGGSNPLYSWYINNLPIASTNDTITLTNLNSNDRIRLHVRSSYLCAIPDTVSAELTISYANPFITYSALQLHSSPGSSYQWYFDGHIIVGAISQDHTPVSIGNYQVEVTDTNNCSVLSNNYYFNITNIPEIDVLYSILPNPADEKIFIKGVKKVSEINIIETTGRIIRRISNNHNPEIEIYTGDLHPGAYVIQFRSEKINKLFPLLIAHPEK